MEQTKKNARYARIYAQLEGLTAKCRDTHARMATLLAVLHHKMDYFFWTGFYILNNGELIVRQYQGPVACQALEKGRGVCWAAIERREVLIVDDVHSFPGHIACDSRSKSEIVVPLRDKNGEIIGVLDVDSKEPAAFGPADAEWLEKILNLVFV